MEDGLINDLEHQLEGAKSNIEPECNALDDESISFLLFWRAVGSVVLKSLPKKSVSDRYGVG